jgi:hypothetical protein
MILVSLTPSDPRKLPYRKIRIPETAIPEWKMDSSNVHPSETEEANRGTVVVERQSSPGFGPARVWLEKTYDQIGKEDLGLRIASVEIAFFCRFAGGEAVELGRSTHTGPPYQEDAEIYSVTVIHSC